MIVLLSEVWILLSTGGRERGLFPSKCSSHTRGKGRANERKETWQMCGPGEGRQQVAKQLMEPCPWSEMHAGILSREHVASPWCYSEDLQPGTPVAGRENPAFKGHMKLRK